jgi:hypothetical protein
MKNTRMMAWLLCCLGCSTEDELPAPAAVTSTPQRTMIENAGLALRADNLFTDPLFASPGFSRGEFFGVRNKDGDAPIVRLTLWDAPFGKRSPALFFQAKGKDTGVVGGVVIPQKGIYRISVWVSGAKSDGKTWEPEELPEGVRAQLLLASGSVELAALAAGETKTVGLRTWTHLEATFATEAQNCGFYVRIPSERGVLVAAPELSLAPSKIAPGMLTRPTSASETWMSVLLNGTGGGPPVPILAKAPPRRPTGITR